MKSIIKKLFLDLFRAYTKLGLCIIAAVISAWGIGTVVYSYLMSERDFKANFSSTVPADFILSLRPPASSLLDELKSDKSIQSIERREVTYGRTKKYDGSWLPIMLFGVEDIATPSVMKFTVADREMEKTTGVFIEKNGEKLIEGFKEIQINVPGYTTIVLRLNGFVHDPGMAPSQMDQLVYGYTSLNNIPHLLKTDIQRFLFKTNLNDPNKEELQSEVDRISLLIKNKGGLVLSSVIPEPGVHPHQGIVNGISYLQKSFGVTLFLLGIILLSLILLTWLYPQLPDIGVLKAIGASTKMIFAAYAVVLMSIIITGLTIGLTLGYKTAVFYNSFIAGLQNFVPVKEVLPISNHVWVIIPALCIPLFIGMIPLRKIANTTVHDALNTIFYTPHKGIFKVSQRFFRSTKITYGFNNLFRSNQRALLLIVLLTIGISLFLSAYNLRYSINREFSDFYKNSKYNLSITLRDTLSEKLSFLKKMPFVNSVAYSAKENVALQLPNKANPVNTTLKTYGRDFKVSKLLLLKGTVQENCSSCLYVNQKFKEDFEEIPIGTPIDIKIDKKKLTYSYAGIYKELGLSSVYVFSDKDLSGYKEVILEIDKNVDLSKASQQIDDSLLSHDIEVEQLMNISTFATSMENHLRPTYLIIAIMGITTIIIGIIGMLIVLNLSLKERVREMGIMKAIGVSGTQIAFLFAIEYFLINLVSAIFSFFMAYGLTFVFCRVLASLGLNLELPARNDYVTIAQSLMILILIQTITIFLYCKFKVRKSSTTLLNTIV